MTGSCDKKQTQGQAHRLIPQSRAGETTTKNKHLQPARRKTNRISSEHVIRHHSPLHHRRPTPCFQASPRQYCSPGFSRLRNRPPRKQPPTNKPPRSSPSRHSKHSQERESVLECSSPLELSAPPAAHENTSGPAHSKTPRHRVSTAAFYADVTPSRPTLRANNAPLPTPSFPSITIPQDKQPPSQPARLTSQTPPADMSLPPPSCHRTSAIQNGNGPMIRPSCARFSFSEKSTTNCSAPPGRRMFFDSASAWRLSRLRSLL